MAQILAQTFKCRLSSSRSVKSNIELPSLARIGSASRSYSIATRPRLRWPGSVRSRIAMGLLALERQGRHAKLIEGRRKLRAAHPALFARYMQN